MSAPHLPIELWTKIASYRCKQAHGSPDDESYPWLNVRHVNKLFATGVESYMIRRYLRRAYTRLSIGYAFEEFKDDEEGLEGFDASLSLELSGFDSDIPRLAILRSDDELTEIEREEVVERLQAWLASDFEKGDNTWKAPIIQQTMQFKRHVYELPLIDLQIGADTGDIWLKFDWRATFTVWFSEQRDMVKIRRSHEAENTAYIDSLQVQHGGNSSRFAGDRFKLDELMNDTLHHFQVQEQNAFKQVRRKRMLRLLRKMDELRFDSQSAEDLVGLSQMGEETAVRNMRKMDDFVNGLLEFSDDSSDGEEEEHWEEMDSEDEDEDEDEEDQEYGSDDSLD